MGASRELREADLGLDGQYPSEVPLRRLPGGPGLSADYVAKSQLQRLFASLAVIVAEDGYEAMTAARVADRAAVFRKRVHDEFTNKQGLFCAVYEDAMARLQRQIETALAEAPTWPQSLPAAIAAALDLLATYPALARLIAVEVFAAGPVAVDSYRAAVGRLAALLRRAREQQGAEPELSLLTEEVLIGGAISLVAAAILDGRGERLRELKPAIAELLLAPYLGAAEAHRIAAAPRG